MEYVLAGAVIVLCMVAVFITTVVIAGAIAEAKN